MLLSGIVRNLSFCLLITLVSTACHDSQANQGGEMPFSLDYSVLKAKQIRLTRELSGRVSPLTISEVRPQVSGIIKERYFEEGTNVGAGEVLYKIDPAIFQAAFNSAQANLERVEANLVSAELLARRYDSLLKTNGVSKQDHADAIARYKQAKAEVMAAKEALETARINLGYTEVTSPISGRIGRSFVTPGALVIQNQPTALATVQQLDPVYVDVTQSSTELLKLQRAFKAGYLRSSKNNAALVHLKLEDGSSYVTNPDYADKGEEPNWIDGELLFSDVTVDQGTGSVNLRAKFDNHDNILLPGMYVRAILEEGVRENAILIPQYALMRTTRGEPYVYILSKEPQNNSDNSNVTRKLKDKEFFVEIRFVTIDRDYKNQWLISSGLKENDLLVLDGLQKVRSGKIVIGNERPQDKVMAHLSVNKKRNL